ncbi:unnamed protein product, partial [Linum tenue]
PYQRFAKISRYWILRISSQLFFISISSLLSSLLLHPPIKHQTATPLLPENPSALPNFDFPCQTPKIINSYLSLFKTHERFFVPTQFQRFLLAKEVSSAFGPVPQLGSDHLFIWEMAAAGTESLRWNLAEEVGVSGCNGNLVNGSGSGSEEFHVLAVDDSIVDRKLIERLLKSSSFKVTAVDSGTRALQYLGLDGEKSTSAVGADCSVLYEIWQDLKVNLIMTDYSMPGMTGYELLKKIKESKAFKEIPVVIMSSENVLTRIHSCLEEGAEDFLMKPVKKSDVTKLKDFMVKGDQAEKGKRSSIKRKMDDDILKLTMPPTAIASSSSEVEDQSSSASHSPSSSSSSPCSSPCKRTRLQ